MVIFESNYKIALPMVTNYYQFPIDQFQIKL